MRKIVAVFFALTPFVSLFSACVVSNAAPRVYVSQFKTAEDITVAQKKVQNENWLASALGKPFLTSRLARPDAPFVCVANIKGATHELESVLTTLRSKENVYRSETYGVETRTITWQLDLIVQLKRLSDEAIVFSKTVTGLCNEQRPISEAKFDNDLFHSLMVSAIEEVADYILEFFGPESGSSDLIGVSAAPSGSRHVAGCGSGGERAATVRETIAVMKPHAGDGVSEAEIMMLWDFLESKVGGGTYVAVSRANISRMMDEIGLTTSSYLTDPNARNRAKVGRLATVSKLLAPSVGRFGNRYLLTLKAFDSSTAEIDGGSAESMTAASLDLLLPMAADAMSRIVAPPPEGFFLAPVAVYVSDAPAWIASAVFEGIRAAFAETGISVKTETGARAAVVLVPSVTMYSLRLVGEGGASRYRGDIAIQLSANGAAPIPVKLTDVDLGKVEGAAPSWLTKERGEKLLALAMENMAQKLSSLRVK